MRAVGYLAEPIHEMFDEYYSVSLEIAARRIYAG
jgi:hypothetical protein